MGAIFLIIFLAVIALGIYKIGSKSADDAKSIGKYDIEDLQRQERYNYIDSDEEEDEIKRAFSYEFADTTGDPSYNQCPNNIAYHGDDD